MIRNRIFPLDTDPGSVVYEHLRRLIAATVYKAVRNGYDRQEAESAANYGFALGLNTFRPELGDPVAWIMTKVRYAVKDTMKYRKFRNLPTPKDPDLFDPPEELDECEPFDLTAVLLGLSDDARAWVVVALDPPDSVVADAKRLGWSGDAAMTRGIEAAKYRQAVFNFFKESGWSAKRTLAAYLEAAKSLGGGK